MADPDSEREPMYKLFVRGAKRIVTVTSKDVGCLVGENMGKPEILEDINGLGMLVDRSGRIAAVGRDSDLRWHAETNGVVEEVNAKGACIIPGLIDAHTHPVFDGDRTHEFAMKLAGASYLEIHSAGGGIHFSVEKTRDATEIRLLKLLEDRLNVMLSFGTTTIEAKSGYGLDWDTELKMLKVLNAARDASPVEISVTYCGAHAVPKGMTSTEAIDSVVNEQIPNLKNLIDDGSLHVENVDVFCEKDVFTLEESQKVLEAGMKIGLAANFHGDELNATGSAEMGAALGVRTISHLEHATPEGIAAMAKSGTVAVLIPATVHQMKLKSPLTRSFIEAGVPVALATDFNPNTYCLSMPHAMTLACIVLGLTMEESLVGATINAAASIGRGHSHGALAKGRAADFVILDTDNWQHLIHHMCNQHNLIRSVYKNGKLVYSKST